MVGHVGAQHHDLKHSLKVVLVKQVPQISKWHRRLRLQSAGATLSSVALAQRTIYPPGAMESCDALLCSIAGGPYNKVCSIVRRHPLFWIETPNPSSHPVALVRVRV